MDAWSRYRFAGAVYDVVSLDAVLYRPPRRRLLELLDPLVGATVLDVGCGTGLNLSGLQRAVGQTGSVIGVDASVSMLAHARSRMAAAGWDNVTLVHGDATDLPAMLDRVGIDIARVNAVVGTYVLSLLPEDAPLWATLDELAAHRQLQVGIADFGEPTTAPAILRPLYQALVKLGGGDASRRPWDEICRRDPAAAHETFYGGHVHIAAGRYGQHHQPGQRC